MQFCRGAVRILPLAFVAAFAWTSLAFRTDNAPGVDANSVVNVELQRIAEKGYLADLRWPKFSDHRTDLINLYGPTGYSPLWLQGTRPTPQALSLIEVFRNAWKKGLEPEDYDASRWNNRLSVLEGSDDARARFEVALTVCTMRFVSDLHIGRINPQHFKFGLSVENKKYDLGQFLRDRLLPAKDPTAVLEGVEPPFGGYRRTEAALLRYVELASKDDNQKLPVPAKAINPGQAYSGIPRLRHLLTLIGDLPPDAKPSAGSQIYDDDLANAVKAFQRRHGLNDDGRLGPETVKQLNVPLSDRLGQLQLALERWRWLPSEFSAPPIVVNIPDFRLRAVDENNKVALEMRVVVGKSMRTQTPVFSREMTYVVLRPYWNVPPSILRGEILPAIQRDNTYLQKKRYEVTNNAGDVITSQEVSEEVMSDLKAGKLAVRQRPGPTNALGLVKLIFPNEFNVYLHSTPAPELFSRTRRDFSHGCIRVEKPAELTAWALRNNPGWTVDRIQRSMQEGSDNVTVTLTRPVPVFIVYATALAYENGEVHFYDDIYGHDAKLVKALAKGYPYP
jgi:murein L,D-transpeptidase YcbB/YkuD